MNEIEKLYKKARIKKSWTAIGFNDMEDCHPSFTAEKQLELIIFIINKFGTLIFFDNVEFTREVMAKK